MFHALEEALAPAVVERGVLAINHILKGEPIAMDRLRRHSGRCVLVLLRDWPKLLPALPPLAFVVTPAGLLEWAGQGEVPAADLEVRVDASNPAWLALQAWGGELPAVDVQGDASLATDVNWLLENVRWDVEADLARLVDPRIAHQAVRVGSAFAAALRAAFRAGRDLAARVRPEGS